MTALNTNLDGSELKIESELTNQIRHLETVGTNVASIFA